MQGRCDNEYPALGGELKDSLVYIETHLKNKQKTVFQSKSSTVFLYHISTAWHSARLISKIEPSHKHSFFVEFCLSQQMPNLFPQYYSD